MPRVGLVLGSGGLAGTAFHAGVLTALAELGWDARTAEVIVGTSAGATSAALLRAGLPPRDYVARISGTPMSAEGDRVMAGIPPLAAPPVRGRRVRRAASPELLLRTARRPWTARLGTLTAAALPAGVVSTVPIAGPYEALFGAGWPTEPMWLCATSLDDGRRMVFGRDQRPAATVAEAVAASCAIPGHYQPVLVGGQRFVDGGAWSLCNADLVAGLDLDAVVVSAPMATADWPGVGWRAGFRAAARLQLERELARIRLAGTPVLVLAPTAADRAVMDGAAMDAGRRPVIARQVHGRMRRRLARDPAGVRALVRD
jgi:NTE family protein